VFSVQMVFFRAKIAIIGEIRHSERSAIKFMDLLLNTIRTLFICWTKIHRISLLTIWI